MKKIILVEDDTAIREVFSIALDAGHYEIVAYETGNPILKGEVLRPDLFMLDKNIAGIDGLDLCRFIKQAIDTIIHPLSFFLQVPISKIWHLMPAQMMRLQSPLH